MGDYKYKYILRDNKTFKYECAYDSYIESCIKNAQEDYESELEHALSWGGGEDDVWHFGGEYYAENGVFVFKVIEYRSVGCGKTPTGKEWHTIVEGHNLPDDVMNYTSNEPVSKKEFMSDNPDIGYIINY